MVIFIALRREPVIDPRIPGKEKETVGSITDSRQSNVLMASGPPVQHKKDSYSRSSDAIGFLLIIHFIKPRDLKIWKEELKSH